MKYLWLMFFVCLFGLIAQVKLADPLENPFADGSLACFPMPPARERAEPPLLPAPVLTHIPPLANPVQVQATSIEILDPRGATGLMVETRQADNIDWGLPRSLPIDAPRDLSYAAEPRIVAPVPVNVPAPAPVLGDVLDLTELANQRADAWHPALEKWQSDLTILTMAIKADAGSQPMTSAPEPAPAAVAAAVDYGGFYPVPDAQPLEMASLKPKQLVSPPQTSSPNLYLPDGALDEEGAMMTLIKPELRIYELPDEGSASAPRILKSGENIRPLTRLRNAEGHDWIKLSVDEKSWWAQAEYFIRVDPRNRRQFPEGNLAVGEEQVDKDSALPVDYHPDDLTDIEGEYTFGAKNVQVRRDVAEALERMATAAKEDGFKIRVFSGFRDFAYQKRLYLDAVDKNGPKQNGTAAPGYSEHQLGTTVDICNDSRRTILSGTFGETPEGRWLHENSERFGFRKSYTKENTDQVGYKPEPWHFRYVGIAEKKNSRDVARR